MQKLLNNAARAAYPAPALNFGEKMKKYAAKKYATITVIGRDKTGVVARVTSFLFLQKANIDALEEQVTRGQFSMTVQTSWKDRQLDRDAVLRGLEKLGRELEME